jgi:hypothetical protein
MTKSKRRLIAREGTLGFCGLLILINSYAIPNKAIFPLAQAQRKSVSKGVVLRNIEQDPIKISNIQVAAAARRFEEEFDANDDWLKTLSFEVENNFNRPIIYLQISLSFPETKSSGNEMAFIIYRGNRPGDADPHQRENFLLAPGTKEPISMAESYDRLSRFLQTRHSIQRINRIEMGIELAVFDNETAWGGGEFFVRDPNRVGVYVPVTKPPAQ